MDSDEFRAMTTQQKVEHFLRDVVDCAGGRKPADIDPGFFYLRATHLIEYVGRWQSEDERRSQPNDEQISAFR